MCRNGGSSRSLLFAIVVYLSSFRLSCTRHTAPQQHAQATVQAHLLVRTDPPGLHAMVLKTKGVGESIVSSTGSGGVSLTYNVAAEPLDSTSDRVLCHTWRSSAEADPEGTTCVSVGRRSLRAHAALTIRELPPLQHHILHSYVVSSSELLEPILLDLVLNKRPEVLELGLQLSPFAANVGSPAWAAGVAALTEEYCRSTGVVWDGCGQQLAEAAAQRAVDRVKGWLTDGRAVTMHALVVTSSNLQPVVTGLEDRVAVLVNTNYRFVNVTLPRLLDSLIGGGWPPHLIYVVVGGSDERNVREHESGAVILEEPLDLIDFTAFRAVMSGAVLSPPAYWFYVHDTMGVGPYFRNLLLQRTAMVHDALEHDTPSTIALAAQADRSMNIGLYAHSYLMATAREFEQEVVRPLELQGLHERKKTGGALEDYLLTKATGGLSHVYCLEQEVEGEPSDIYGTGTLRKTLRYGALNVTKYQANWMIKVDERFKMEP